jgi:aminoglycoside phosphotransferase (APT) family kinase protein
VVSSSDARLQALTGGVSSEIYLVDDAGRQFVVKRALEKLKVKDDWYADISRNESEYAYIEYVSQFAPESVPQLFKKGQGYFAMEHLGSGFENWKQLLLDGTWNPDHAHLAGSLLSKVHNASRNDAAAAVRFNYEKNFWELRIEPYIVTTGNRHPELKALFDEEAERLGSIRECLVHGDYSPKNILISGKRLVALDCEVANYGDPVFDYCFLLTHLLLKALFHLPGGLGMKPLVEAFMSAYQSGVDGSDAWRKEFAGKGGPLLAMLLLARVDGKSPVEYLTEAHQHDFIRSFVYRVLKDPVGVDAVVENWFTKLRLK